MKIVNVYNASWLLVATLMTACGNGNNKADAYGNFESTEIMVSTETAGKVLAMKVEEGDEVDSGQIICQIDTLPLHLQREQLLASRASVQTGLRKVNTAIGVQQSQRQMVERDLTRLQQMKAENAATAKQLDDATGQLDVLNKQIENTRAQIDGIVAEQTVIDTKIASLNDQMTRCTVVAPQSGTILNKLAEGGELLSAGKPVVKLAKLNPMVLRAYITGDMLPQLKIGERVNVLFDRNDAQNDTLVGVITWVSSTAEFTPKIIQTKQERVNQVYAFKVEVPNDGRIKIGMPGEVVLEKKGK